MVSSSEVDPWLAVKPYSTLALDTSSVVQLIITEEVVTEVTVKRLTVGGLLTMIVDDDSVAVIKLWPQE